MLIAEVALQTIPNFRIRTIPVLGTLPAIFGMAAASWILCELAGSPFFPDPVFHIRRPQYETILEELQNQEIVMHGHCDDVAVDLEEVRPARSWHECADGVSGSGFAMLSAHMLQLASALWAVSSMLFRHSAAA